MPDIMVVPEDWKEFLSLLKAREVEFLVVGAHAMAHHGLPRLTGDLDLFVEASPANAGKLILALSDFGFGEAGIDAEALSAPGPMLMLGVPPNRIDILTSLSGLAYVGAAENSVAGRIGDVDVRFLGKGDLILNKRSAGRLKDLDDLKRLTD